MEELDSVALKLMSRAKRGTLDKAKPDLLTFRNLTHTPPSRLQRGISYSAIQVAALHGHLDQIPVEVFEKLQPHEQIKLKRNNETARKHKEAVARGEDVPF